MSREWKPGDVALVDSWRGKGQVAFRVERQAGLPVWCVLDERDTRGVFEGEVESARPAVVLDPEDREQVERLIRLWVVATSGCPDALRVTEPQIDRLQAALRDLANPTPRIEEPAGLGAVVADEDGDNYVKVALGPHGWVLANAMTRIDSGHGGRSWRDLTPVRVLSPGVEVSQ